MCEPAQTNGRGIQDLVKGKIHLIEPVKARRRGSGADVLNDPTHSSRHACDGVSRDAKRGYRQVRVQRWLDLQGNLAQDDVIGTARAFLKVRGSVRLEKDIVITCLCWRESHVGRLIIGCARSQGSADDVGRHRHA